MGGCCCCSSRGTELSRTSVPQYCPQALEESEPLPSRHVAAVSPALIVHTDLETCSPDTHRAPPAPLPYDLGLVSSQTLPQSFETDQVQYSESRPLEENISSTNFETCTSLKESNCKNESNSGNGSPNVAEDEPSKLSVPVSSPVEEEDVCPTCLEEYDTDNPCITTKCRHHFHLSCILEWMERSDTCAICDQIMVIDCTFKEKQLEKSFRKSTVSLL